MLVPGKQDIKIELLTDAVGDIFVGGGKHPAGGKIPLEPTVIDAEVEVGFAAELFSAAAAAGMGSEMVMPERCSGRSQMFT